MIDFSWPNFYVFRQIGFQASTPGELLDQAKALVAKRRLLEQQANLLTYQVNALESATNEPVSITHDLIIFQV